MTNCLFCKIINGEIPCYKIYEDNKTLAFLDISGDAYGHTLVVPKKHFDNIYETTPESISDIFKTIKTITNHYKSLGFDGVNIVNNSGTSSGQTINHIHFHLFPRKANDNINLYTSLENQNFDLKEIQKFLKFN